MSQENTPSDLILNQEFFNNLPSDAIIEILSRLTVKEVLTCKGVCTSWLHLIRTRQFVKAHLSKSAQGLAVFQLDNWTNLYRLYELEDEEYVEEHDQHYNLLSNFELPFSGWLYGSTDGLLFMCELSGAENSPDALYICNPITREYVNLDSPREFAYTSSQVVTYGFGSSRGTGQYKVVRIFHDRIQDPITKMWRISSEVECHVYTLRTGSWRSIPSQGMLEHLDHINGSFSNGNVHWMVRDLNRRIRISCFDLEAESFTTFSPPPFPGEGRLMNFAAVTIFPWEGCLGLCDNTSHNEVVIWSMQEYGVETSWTRKFVMRKDVIDYGGETLRTAVFYPVKIFKDGDILFAWKDFLIIYYSSRYRTVQEVDIFSVEPDNMLDAILYTPTFLSLPSIGIENVISF